MNRNVLAIGLAVLLAAATVDGAQGQAKKAPKAKAKAGAKAGQGWVNLFDGKTLNGWEVKSGTATYRVEQGTIVGTTADKSPNTFLCTKKEYCDFVLEFEVMCDPALNSGVQFRSHAYPKEITIEVAKNGKKAKRVWPAGRVYGYQVEIASNGSAGGVYDEARRATWLYNVELDPQQSKAFKVGEWNKYRVECRGDRIRTWVNGVACADFQDAADACGLIGLQVHAVTPFQKLQVRWRNIRIKEL